MSLDASDIETIKATWLCVRQDNVASGCLLFKKLFTKYPQYLTLFTIFPDLDLEHMRDDKRLLKHAVGVIDTVSFVVDSLGDERQTSERNEQLVSLVKRHLGRKIGLDKFRNLGEILIEFISELNQNQSNNKVITATTNDQQLNKRQQQQQQQQDSQLESLRSAWSKLYGIILSIVQHEEANL